MLTERLGDPDAFGGGVGDAAALAVDRQIAEEPVVSVKFCKFWAGVIRPREGRVSCSCKSSMLR